MMTPRCHRLGVDFEFTTMYLMVLVLYINGQMPKALFEKYLILCGWFMYCLIIQRYIIIH